MGRSCMGRPPSLAGTGLNSSGGKDQPRPALVAQTSHVCVWQRAARPHRVSGRPPRVRKRLAQNGLLVALGTRPPSSCGIAWEGGRAPPNRPQRSLLFVLCRSERGSTPQPNSTSLHSACHIWYRVCSPPSPSLASWVRRRSPGRKYYSTQ